MIFLNITSLIVRSLLKYIYYRLKSLPISPQSALVNDSEIRVITNDCVVDIIQEVNDKKEVFFIQIGSNDGISNDPLHVHIIQNYHWRGVLVEPVPYLFARLIENYKDYYDRLYFENVLISEIDGNTEFYYVAPGASEHINNIPKCYEQIGALSKKHIITHLGECIIPFVEMKMLPSMSIEKLI